MQDLARGAVQAAVKAGADYADARVGGVRTEDLIVRNGVLAVAQSAEDFGIGLRVLKGGRWGYAAAPLDCDAGEGDLRELARRAVRLAGALGGCSGPAVDLGPELAEHGEYRTPLKIDPFAVPLEEKLELLSAADASMEGEADTVVREASVGLRRERQWQATSEGGEIEQELVRCGAGISSVAARSGQVERRSWPAAFGGNYKSAGWEHVAGLDLPSHGARVRDEALLLCVAEPCPEGRRDLILMGNQLMLQIHESVGHPTELDRVFGHEVDLAGSSFASPEMLEGFQYGSPIVNLVADSTVPGGLDTRGWDDDGVPSGRWHIVKDGVFRGFHTSREWIGNIPGETRSRGTNRAEGWYHPPIIRITNLSLMPGEWTLDDLIADTENGVLCDTVKMWSIDQRRLNFQFTTEIGWEIEDGKLGKPLRNPTYQGTTPEFWRSCDAICDADHWELWGVPNCGKGNPMQVAEMSHGAAPARFRGVNFVR